MDEATTKVSEKEILEKNRHFYDELWGNAELLEAHHFNTWTLIKRLLEGKNQCLEIAPGLRPRLPIENTHQIDISRRALNKLKAKGGHAISGSVTDLPLSNSSFDLICALDIIEHVESDETALKEMARIAKPGATLILSTPLHQSLWTPFDEFVGHYRRYAPDALLELLNKNHFQVSHSAIFGMKPKTSGLVSIGTWFLKHDPRRAMWWYNKIFPYVARRQKPLQLVEGLTNLDDIGEVLLVCEYKGN
jgi:SAM-dependent methyltransferase